MSGAERRHRLARWSARGSIIGGVFVLVVLGAIAGRRAAAGRRASTPGLNPDFAIPDDDELPLTHAFERSFFDCGCPDTYFCPTTGDTECPRHGGFDVCCNRTGKHVPLHDHQEQRRAMAALWQVHAAARFPTRLRDEHVLGVDMMMLDADVAGLHQSWEGSVAPAGWQRQHQLRQLLSALDVVLLALNDPEERRYFSRLHELAQLMYTAGR